MTTISDGNQGCDSGSTAHERRRRLNHVLKGCVAVIFVSIIAWVVSPSGCWLIFSRAPAGSELQSLFLGRVSRQTTTQSDLASRDPKLEQCGNAYLSQFGAFANNLLELADKPDANRDILVLAAETEFQRFNFESSLRLIEKAQQTPKQFAGVFDTKNNDQELQFKRQIFQAYAEFERSRRSPKTKPN